MLAFFISHSGPLFVFAFQSDQNTFVHQEECTIFEFIAMTFAMFVTKAKGARLAFAS